MKPPGSSVIVGDCRDVLATLPASGVQCVVTSPPYFGLRDYGMPDQIGLEPTPDDFVAALVAVFSEVRRVLRDDGCVFINLGDSYAGHNARGFIAGNEDKNGGASNKNGVGYVAGLKPKDLIGIPWMVAFALRADGWYLRQEIIWHKPNPMPESVLDRCTKAHESVFLLTKRPTYFFDAQAIAEPATGRETFCRSAGGYIEASGRNDGPRNPTVCETRNRRSVWTIASQAFSGSHYATMPPALAELCIKAGTSERGQCPNCGAPWARVVAVLDPGTRQFRANRAIAMGHNPRGPTAVTRAGEPSKKSTTGWAPTCTCTAHTPVPQMVLDPFGGAGTTGLVADRLQRSATMIELNPAFAAMARQRIIADGGLFSGAAE